MTSLSSMPVSDTDNLKEKILEENRRVHALEDKLYLKRHPEQTNFFQTRILERTVDGICSRLKNPDAHILDLGCGTGYLFLRLLERGYRVTGLDLSEEMIRVLDQDIPEESRPRARLVVSEVEEFARRDRGEDYDAVLLSALLHHLFDYESVVRKYCEKLKPGGLFLVFFEPLKQEIVSPFRYALHKSLARLDESIYRLEMKCWNISLFEEDYHLSDYQRQFGGIDLVPLEEMLRGSDMEILKIEKYCSRRYGLSASIATRLLATQNTFNMFAEKI